jgi:hypothetical protein
MIHPLIGLTGFKGSGKSSVSSILREEYGYIEEAWAQPLKREIFDAFGGLLLRSIGRPATFEYWLRFIDAHKYDAPESQYGWLRPLLQFWGTEYRRAQDADYWVKQLPLHPGTVVSDCRFENECQAITNAGGVVWRVQRPSLGANRDPHPSEAHVPHLSVQVVLVNGGTLADLRMRVRALMAAYDTAVS